MTVLRTWSPEDGILGAVGPLALATAAGTALVVDLDPAGPSYPGDVTLAQLVAEGPTHDDLRPGRRGVAVLPNGGVTADASAEVVGALVEGWPNVVLRMRQSERPSGPGVVPILPLMPTVLFEHQGPAVYQRGPWPAPGPVDGVVLPRVRATVIRALLEGRRPVAPRWLRAWRKVWSLTWP